MARPTKPIDLFSGKIGSDNIEARKSAEQKLKGACDNIKPPSYLTPQAKKVFKSIVESLESSGILSNADVDLIAQTSEIIVTLRELCIQKKNDPSIVMDRAFVSTYKDYTNMYLRYCNELGLSPQSRAKMANIIAQTQSQDEDPVIKLLERRGSHD